MAEVFLSVLGAAVALALVAEARTIPALITRAGIVRTPSRRPGVSRSEVGGRLGGDRHDREHPLLEMTGDVADEEVLAWREVDGACL